MKRSIQFFAIATLATAAFAFGEAATQPATQPAPYPLTTCIVSGGKLGSMGDAVVTEHNGREIKFCCKSCVKTFKKNPDKYMKKLDEAEAKLPATQPAK